MAKAKLIRKPRQREEGGVNKVLLAGIVLLVALFAMQAAGVFSLEGGWTSVSGAVKAAFRPEYAHEDGGDPFVKRVLARLEAAHEAEDLKAIATVYGELNKLEYAYLTPADSAWLCATASQLDGSAVTPEEVNNALAVLQLSAWAGAETKEADKISKSLKRAIARSYSLSTDLARRVLEGAATVVYHLRRLDVQEAKAINREIMAAAIAARLPLVIREAFNQEQYLLSNEEGDFAAAAHSGDACVDWFAKNMPEIYPDTCQHSKGLMQMWMDDPDASVATYAEEYHKVAAKWRRLSDGKPCPATFLPLALESTTQAQRDSVDGLVTHFPGQRYWDAVRPEGADFSCSDQQWPYFLKGSESPPQGSFTLTGQKVQGGGRTWEKAEYKASPLDAVRCNALDSRRPVLFQMKNVQLSGKMKTISKEDPCVILSPGFQLTNSNSLPEVSDVELRAQIRKVKRAVMLPSMERNYFHSLIEGSQQVLLPQLFDVMGDDSDVQVIAHRSGPGVCTFTLLQTPVHKLLGYSRSEERMEVEELFVFDLLYPDDDNEGYHHPEERYVPPIDILLYVQRNLMHMLTESDRQAEARFVTLVSRGNNTRSVTNFDDLVAAVEPIAHANGLAVQVHHGDELALDQVKMFYSSAAVIGTHGAGLVNTMFCRKHTPVIVIPSWPTELSVFASMASSFHLPFWSVPSAENNRFKMAKLTKENLGRVAATLDVALQERP